MERERELFFSRQRKERFGALEGGANMGKEVRPRAPEWERGKTVGGGEEERRGDRNRTGGRGEELR